jgi:hypothetical protein
LSLHTGIPVGLEETISGAATRALPAEKMRRWKVMPYRVAQGQLHVLTSEIPTEEMTRDLASVSALHIRYRLLPPSELEPLSYRYDPRNIVV